MDIFHTILPSILSTCCELCRSPSKSVLCSACQTDLPLNKNACRICALPLEGDSCPDCIARPKIYDAAVCAFSYEHPLDQLIHRFKQHSPHSLLNPLTSALEASILKTHTVNNLPSALIPVPQYWRKIWKRGFHPTRLIADQLGSALDKPVLPDHVRSTRATEQKTLRRSTRLKNLQGVFALTGNALPQSVALIDDVVTTGATAEALTKLLLEAGVEEVHLWALARTP